MSEERRHEMITDEERENWATCTREDLLLFVVGFQRLTDEANPKYAELHETIVASGVDLELVKSHLVIDRAIKLIEILQ